jgi:hypothetical protein
MDIFVDDLVQIWTWLRRRLALDGIPNIPSVMIMRDYWADYYDYVEKEVSADRLFDTSIAKQAMRRLETEKPFAIVAVDLSRAAGSWRG